MSARKPYISITGIMSIDEARALAGKMQELKDRFGDHHDLFLGLLVSRKTLAGEKNRWPERFPHIDHLSSLVTEAPGVYSLVHWNTDEPWRLAGPIVGISHMAKNIHGFQLNMAWPSIESLAIYRVFDPKAKIILQVGVKAMEMLGNSPLRVASVLSEYESFVDYALYDPSGGKGTPFDITEMYRYIDAAYQQGVHESTGIGFAGGLGPDTVEPMCEFLIGRYPGLSIDAEGKLRDENDHLDLEKASTYLENAYRMFSK